MFVSICTFDVVAPDGSAGCVTVHSKVQMLVRLYTVGVLLNFALESALAHFNLHLGLYLLGTQHCSWVLSVVRIRSRETRLDRAIVNIHRVHETCVAI